MKIDPRHTSQRVTDEITRLKAGLMGLAAEMATCKSMPSEYLEDWDLPISTPVKTLLEIERSSLKANIQCKDWAIALRRVIDRLQENFE